MKETLTCNSYVLGYDTHHRLDEVCGRITMNDWFIGKRSDPFCPLKWSCPQNHYIPVVAGIKVRSPRQFVFHSFKNDFPSLLSERDDWLVVGVVVSGE